MVALTYMTATKILFVDDEEDITEFLSYNFKKFGFEVRKADNGISGIKVLENWKPDIIVADIMMPEMNGIGFCKEVKQNEATKDIPFLFLSATHDEYVMLNAMQAGGNHYLSKPVRIDLLHLIIKNLLNQKKEQAA